jgi:hypothetical protein
MALTATTNADVDLSADYIDIVDQSGTILASCATGHSCSVTVSATSPTTVQYTALLAQFCNSNDIADCDSDASGAQPATIDARSAPISVSWQ